MMGWFCVLFLAYFCVFLWFFFGFDFVCFYGSFLAYFCVVLRFFALSSPDEPFFFSR